MTKNVQILYDILLTILNAKMTVVRTAVLGVYIKFIVTGIHEACNDIILVPV